MVHLVRAVLANGHLRLGRFSLRMAPLFAVETNWHKRWSCIRLDPRHFIPAGPVTRF